MRYVVETPDGSAVFESVGQEGEFALEIDALTALRREGVSDFRNMKVRRWTIVDAAASWKRSRKERKMAKAKNKFDTIGTLKDAARVAKAAARFVSNDFSREQLTYLRLDECGDAVACDSYRIYVHPHAWEGTSYNLPFEALKWLKQRRVGTGDAVIGHGFGLVSIDVDGEHFECSEAVYDKYVNYKQLLPHETNAKAVLLAKYLIPVTDEVAKRRGRPCVVVGIHGGDLRISPEHGEQPESYVKGCSEGEMVIGFTPKLLRTILSLYQRGEIEIEIENPLKCAWFREVGAEPFVGLMPTKIDHTETAASKRFTPEAKPEPPAPKGGFKEAPKSPEPKPSGAPIALKGERVCITGTLGGMTRGEAFSRLRIAGAEPCEHFSSKVTLFVIAQNAGKSKRDKAEKAIANGQKVRVVNGTEFEKALMEQGKTAGERKLEEKKEEHMAKKEGVNREGLAELLYALAIDRAAKEPDNRLTEGNASPNSATYVWRLEKEGRLSKDEFGNLTSWYLDGDFVTCIERRYSTRKVHLHYPEVKPFAHKSDWVKSRKEQAAKDEAERKAKAAKTEPKEKTNMSNEIEALKAQLAAAKAETESWKRKAEEYYATRHNEPTKPTPEVEAKHDEAAAATVSLKELEAFAKANGLAVNRKNDRAPIWVNGNSKACKAYFTKHGFKWGCHKEYGKGWWLAAEHVK